MSEEFYLCVCVCLTWNEPIHGARQQEVKVLPVSALLLKPCLEHGLYGKHAVLHLLQVDLGPQHQRVWTRSVWGKRHIRLSETL